MHGRPPALLRPDSKWRFWVAHLSRPNAQEQRTRQARVLLQTRTVSVSALHRPVTLDVPGPEGHRGPRQPLETAPAGEPCLLYTSDAADDLLCVDLGGRRIIKKKK